MEQLFQTTCQTVDLESESLLELSQTIWRQPELLFQEKIAHETLTRFLEEHGFHVEPHYKSLSTAFRASWSLTGDSSAQGRALNVAFLCEYDALPEIGHACGHNLIAQLGVAGALAVKATMERHGQPVGTVTVLGTPAEEGGGGKIDLINAGAFDDIDFALMCHPANVNCTNLRTLAVNFVNVTYHGKGSHASAYPWEGVNALDAAVQAYSNISSMRQQMKPTSRVHGIISNGGVKPNIIPDLSKLEYIVRADCLDELKALCKKVEGCFQGAAVASGCTVDVDWSSKFYADLITNRAMAKLYDKHMEGLERDRATVGEDSVPLGSTDMGNVSYVVPTIQPCYKIGEAAPHSREFTPLAGSKAAHSATQNQAKALAQTAIEVLLDPVLFQEIRNEFLTRTEK